MGVLASNAYIDCTNQGLQYYVLSHNIVIHDYNYFMVMDVVGFKLQAHLYNNLLVGFLA